jgi:hypothetical protein
VVVIGRACYDKQRGEVVLGIDLVVVITEIESRGFEITKEGGPELLAGAFEISLPKEVFDKAPKLRDIYPLRDDMGRILMRVPLDGLIYDLTLEQADGIYENGKREDIPAEN